MLPVPKSPKPVAIDSWDKKKKKVQDHAHERARRGDRHEERDEGVPSANPAIYI